MPDPTGRRPITPEEQRLLLGGLETTPEEAPTEPSERTMYPGWTPHLGALVTRLMSGLGSGIASAAPGLGTAAGAGIAGGGEALAQYLESPDPLDKSTIALEAGLGAVPLGWIFREAKAGVPLAKVIKANMARGALFNEAGNIARRYNASGAVLPQTKEELLTDLATSAVGAGFGYLGAKPTHARMGGAGEEALHVPETIPADPEAQLTAAMTAHPSKPGNLIKNSKTPKYTAGFMREPIELPRYTENPDAPMENSGLRVKGRTVTGEEAQAKATGRGAAEVTLENTPAIPGVLKRMADIERTTPDIRSELLESNGMARKPLAIEKSLDHAKEVATKASEVQLAAGRRAQRIENAQAKAEERADLQQTNKEVAAAGKLKTDAEQALEQAQTDAYREKSLREREARAAEERDRAKKAAAYIENATAEMVPGEPVLTKTTARNTSSGKETLRESFHNKQEGGVDIDPEDINPNKPKTGPKPTPKPNIPKEEPENVEQTTYGTKQKALEGIAAAGKRGVPKNVGRGKWVVEFAAEPPAEAATPQHPQAPPPEPPAEPTAPPPVAPTPAPKAPEGGAAPEPPATVKQLPPQEPPAPVAAQPVPTAPKAKPPVTPVRRLEGNPDLGHRFTVTAMHKDGTIEVYLGSGRDDPALMQAHTGLRNTPGVIKLGTGKIPAGMKQDELVRRIAAQFNGQHERVSVIEPGRPTGGQKVGAVAPKPAAPETPVGTGSRSTGNSSMDARLRNNAAAAQRRGEIAGIRREDVATWTPEKIAAVKSKYPKDARIQTIIRDELASRANVKGENPPEAPPAAPVPVKPTPAPKKPSGGAAAEPITLKRVEVPDKFKGNPKVEAAAAKTNESVANLEKQINEAKARVAKELEAKPGESVSEYQKRTRVPYSEAAKAVNEAKARGVAPVKPTEPVTPGKGGVAVQEAPKAPKAPEASPKGPDRVAETKPAVEPAKPVAEASKPEPPAAKAEPAPKETAQQVADRVYGKKETLNVAGAKTGADVRKALATEVEKYKAEWEAYEGTKGVDAKGKYTYAGKPPAPKVIEIPNGPTYTVKNAQQATNLIVKLDSPEGASAFKGLIVGEKSPKASTATHAETNWGSAEKPLLMRQPDADKLGMTPDIVEHDTVVGPKAATEEFAPKGSSTVRYASSADKLPDTARHAIMMTDKDGIRTIFVSDNPNKLTQFVTEWKAQIKKVSGKYAAKRGVQVGVLPEGKTWAGYLGENNIDPAKTKLAIVGGDESFKPLTEPPTPTGGGAKPAPKGGLRVGANEGPPSSPPVGSAVKPVHQAFMEHQSLARKWVEYNSKSGKASEIQVVKTMQRNTAEELQRMLAERGVGKEPTKVPLTEGAAQAKLERGKAEAEKVAAAPKAEGVPTTKDGQTKVDLLRKHGLDEKLSREDLALEQQAAADNYYKLKAQGAPNAEIRAAGTKLGELKAAAALAAKEEGGTVPQIVEPKASPKPTGQGPDSDQLASMPPEQQEAEISKAVEQFKGKKKGKNVTLGAGFGSLQEIYENNPAMFHKLGLSTAGAVMGAASTPDHPIIGGLLGATAGLYAPSVLRAVQRSILKMPVADSIAEREAFVHALYDKLKTAADVYPDLYRASLLSKPPNLVMNTWIGPYGSAVMGSLEKALTGDKRAIEALRELSNPKNFWDEWVNHLRAAQEAVRAAGGSRAEMGSSQLTGMLRDIAAKPADIMTAGDMAAKTILMRHGFTEAEAKALTLTSEPMLPWNKSISNMRKTKGISGQQSFGLSMALPFYRTNANQFEQTLLRLPISGPILRAAWGMPQATVMEKAAQYGMSGGIGIISYLIGKNVKDKQSQRYWTKFLNNFAGPYGVTASAMFIAGAASQIHNDDPVDAAQAAATRMLKDGMAMPNSDFFIGLIKAAGQILHKENPDLPYGVVPPFLSSKDDFSIPTAERYIAGDKKFNQPTKKEYSIAAPFVKEMTGHSPKLKSAGKSPIGLRIAAEKAKVAKYRKAQRDRVRELSGDDY
jgi:hypothetical protein